MKKLLIFILPFILYTTCHAQKEVIYHVFQRSFFDSNADGNGDIEGIRQKLDYLQRLGVTSILLTPLYTSDFYHSYFATDFEKIDPAYGSFKLYRDLVQEAHRRHMKIYQDVEMQYVAGKHPWFTESYKKPGGKFEGYLYYNDKKNEKPWYFYDVPEFTTYNGSKQQLIVVNMKSQAVKDYTLKVLKYWADPNADGNFYDGVDGFRLDHMMDDLDNAGKLKNLFKDFWAPTLANLKKVNPNLKIVGEQADWASYGYDYLTKGTADRVFAFRLQAAIANFDKEQIIAAADSTFNYLPDGKQQVIFLENHDTKRFATVVNGDVRKEKVGAALNLLIGGIPAIYYGQEIGMKGAPIKGETDGNDIPVREAFDWYKSAEGQGMANWYKETGPWWDNRNNKPDDGISAEEQTTDPNSLYSYYRELIKISKNENAFKNDSFKNVSNSSPSVLSFVKKADHKAVLVMINLSETEQVVKIKDQQLNLNGLILLTGADTVKFKRGSHSTVLPPFAVQVWRMMY